MKKKLLTVLIILIALMLSISYLKAQCPGTKMLMFKPGHGNCISRCVSPSQVESYASKGWLLYCPGGGFRFVTPTGKTNTDKIPLSKSKQETVQKINSIIFK
jgi:hypothetical protein